MLEIAGSQALMVRERLRRALREMLGFAAVLAAIIFLFTTTMHGAQAVLFALLAGLMFCPILWGIYRVGRFIVGR